MSYLANDSLQRTEIRAGCVIGIIAAILALRLDARLGSLARDPVLSIIVVYWGIYLGLIAISIENEPLGKRTSSTVKELAIAVFSMGLVLTGFEAILEVANYIDEFFLRNAIAEIFRNFTIFGIPVTGPRIFGFAFWFSAYGILVNTLVRKDQRRKWRTNVPEALILIILATPLFFID